MGWRAGLTELSLVDGWLHLTLTIGGLLALAALLGLRRTRAWWLTRVPIAVLAALVLLAAVWIALDVAKPWPDPLPLAVWAWIGAGLLGTALLLLGWRRHRWWIRVLAVAGALLVVLGAADGVDTVYGSFPTVGAALQLGVYDEAPASEVLAAPDASPAATVQAWRVPAGMPARGAVAEVDIPATRSGFSARSAWVYVPPAYLEPGHPRLPVLLMLGGQPGGPRDWLDGGRLAQRMDAFAATHGGLSPVVVMPDDTGGEVANPLCTDSSLGKVDTYLATDVVGWVQANLQVSADPAQWAVGGFSYGGTCALQLAVAHPELFPTFFDASGQDSPTLGGHDRTVNRAFGGDTAAFDAIDPLQELTRRSYSSSAGYLAVGQEDDRYVPQQQAVVAAAKEAGMAITAEELPGRHDWRVWGRALDDALPWLAGRLGLTP